MALSGRGSFSTHDKLQDHSGAESLGHITSRRLVRVHPKTRSFSRRRRDLSLHGRRAWCFWIHAAQGGARLPRIPICLVDTKSRWLYLGNPGYAGQRGLRTTLEKTWRDSRLGRVSQVKEARGVYLARHGSSMDFAQPPLRAQNLKAALEAGAIVLTLCDTNGGSLPSQISESIPRGAARAAESRLGIYVHTIPAVPSPHPGGRRRGGDPGAGDDERHRRTLRNADIA